MNFYMFFLIFFAIFCGNLKASSLSFNDWKKDFTNKWSVREVPRSFIKKELSDITINEKIIRILNNQVTSSTTLDYPTWISKWIDSKPHRIKEGKLLLKKHYDLLIEIEKKYNVDKEVIIALWGVETLYGNHKGSYDTIQALATLSYKSKRKKFYETQLFTALKIVHRKYTERKNLLGSWSGAMGHCQFMPSSYTRIAVDFDKDGKRDIWNNIPDALASIANYLNKGKWEKGKKIGELTTTTTTTTNNKNLEKIPLKNSPSILRKENYMPIMRWNNSSLFAAMVIILIEEFKK